MAVSSAVLKKGQDTDEYRAIRESFHFVVNHIQHDVQKVANSLFSKFLIPQNEVQKVSTGNADGFSKASSLLTIVLSKVEADANNLYKFIKVLQDLDMAECADCIWVFTDSGPTSVRRLYQSGRPLSHFNSNGSAGTVDSAICDLEDETSRDDIFDDVPASFFTSIDDGFSLDPESVPYHEFVNSHNTMKSQEITIENQKVKMEDLKHILKAKESELEQLKEDRSKVVEELKEMKAQQVDRENKAIKMEGRLDELERKEKHLQSQFEESQEKQKSMSLELERIKAQLAKVTHELEKRTILIDKNNVEKSDELAVKKRKLAAEKDLAVTKRRHAEIELQSMKNKTIMKENSES